MRMRMKVVLVLLSAAVLTADGACRFPGAPAHCSVHFSDGGLDTVSTATYTCERGFELLGPSRRTCVGERWEPEGIPFCVVNVAAGKAPMQSSTEAGSVPQKAIDGSTDTCSLTAPGRRPWWYVNLLEPYMVQLVRIDFGRGCCGQQQPQPTVVVRVGNNRPDLGTNPVCNRFHGPLEEGKPLFLPCNPPMPGAFVSVHLEGTGLAQLSICEAFVYTDQALPIERCPQFRDQPPGSTATYNGKCYVFYSRQPLSFRDAVAFCRGRGGSLVDESNPALQGFISWELWRRHRSDTHSQYWMGAVGDPEDRNNWKWLGGEDVTVSFWNLPGGNEDCARYDGAKGWLWSDTNCKASLNYICQHQPKACGKPEQPPNSTMVAKNFNVGTTIEYTCDPGHLLVGPATRTCLPTGFYNEFPPICKRVECGLPANIANGHFELLDGSAGYGSHVRYSCKEGFSMRGRALLQCDTDERWDGPPPACQAIQCDAPPAVPHGRFSVKGNHTVAGTVVEYSCTRRYVLVGSRSLVCQNNGQYDNQPPVCQEEAKVPVPPATFKPTRPPLLPSRLPPTPLSTTTAAPSTVKSRPRPRPVSQGTPSPPHIIAASHPHDNEIPDSVNARSDHSPGVDLVHPIEEERRETAGARLNLGAIIALGVFGGFVFLAAVITTIVILIRRNRSTKHYRHRASPDCNTVASFDSSGSESRGGLNRYYRQAWENLHQSAGGKAPLRRKETLDTAAGYRNEGLRDGSELVVSGLAPKPAATEKKRHHHHHHHHGSGGNAKDGASDWRRSKTRY